MAKPYQVKTGYPRNIRVSAERRFSNPFISAVYCLPNLFIIVKNCSAIFIICQNVGLKG